jgi:hypothetical protein
MDHIPAAVAGFASFATSPGAVNHLRHDGCWRHRATVAAAGTSHLELGFSIDFALISSARPRCNGGMTRRSSWSRRRR